MAEQDDKADVALRRTLHREPAANECRAQSSRKSPKIADTFQVCQNRPRRHCKLACMETVLFHAMFFTTLAIFRPVFLATSYWRREGVHR